MPIGRERSSQPADTYFADCSPLTAERSVGKRDIQWYADFVETDGQYVKRYYETDKIPSWHECIATNCPRIERKPIPTLERKQVQVRFAF